MSKRTLTLCAGLLLCVTFSTHAEEGFESLFNGKDLTGWEGNTAIWSVKDGAITGTTTAETNLKANTFLVWKGGEVENFELRFKYRIVNGNSGVQYRSKLIDEKQFIAGGYQADFEAGDTYSGILYEERGRGVLALRGQKVVINADGSKTEEQVSDTKELQSHIKKEEWNDYTIIAHGNHLTHKINGHVTAEVIDNQEEKRAMKGILAFQVHVGPPMVVQFKDVEIKKLTTEQGVKGATPPGKMTVAKGFKVELLYSVPKDKQGSWVSLCTDDKGRLIASDQAGSLYRITPVGLNGATETLVEVVPAPIGQAQGMLYAFNALYVVVNGNAAEGPGLYRVTDSDGDDKLDKVQLLRKIEGSSEHGPHAVVLGPDGQSLYVVAGNFTKIPNPEASRAPQNWGEDQLLPRMPDGGGHDPHIMAPAGWVARTDPEGKQWELVAMGMRNTYDIAFNRVGELFGYDSDMEWDIGAPWYRPTRVLHVVSGADYGWRNGSGKWPVYYPESTPAVVDIGVGSPTGIAFGYGTKFPTKYRDALFICDWSFGKMYALHMKENGATYEAQVEPFLSAAPLPLTDLVVNPVDGAMYFTIGGRGVQSGLYRVTYEGEPRQAKIDDAPSRAAKLRHKLESFHGKTDPQAMKEAWDDLGHKDRFVRNAARIAVESQPVATWQEKALKEKDTQRSLTALLALSRQGEKECQPALLEALSRFDYASLAYEQKLAWLRVVQLAFIRMGAPQASDHTQWTDKLDALYPAPSVEENYELSRMLVFLQSPLAAPKTLKLMSSALTQEEQIHYAMVLRVLDTGWTPDLRTAYFGWFQRGTGFHGGHSLDKFIVNMKKEAEAKLSPEDKTLLADVLAGKATVEVAQQAPREFVTAWTVDDVTQLAESKLTGRNYENGRKMFAAAQCFNCHRINSEGGSVGPDLTAVSGRFSPRDLAESIIEPNTVVSDQYRNTMFTLKNGQQVIGRVANLNGDILMVVTNQLAPGDFTNINRNDVLASFESPISPMMPGLLNTLSEQEVLDLMAYLLSGGRRDHAVFK